jgi:phosphoenolpyruvate-protein kinase (PTS system EI component)
MAEQALSGLPASPGIGVGPARLLDARVAVDGSVAVPLSERPAEVERAERALSEAELAVREVAERLAREGRADEAEIVETGAMMAADPTLREAVRTAVTDRGQNAAAAIVEASEAAAATLASLDDPMLAARAEDVRSVGRRAARLAVGAVSLELESAGWDDAVLVASELGPADVAELGEGLAGVALAGGAVTAHAAIVARSLGIPMVVGIGSEILEVTEAEPLVVNGDEGVAVRSPSLARATHARIAGESRARARECAAKHRDLPAITTDGRRLRILANVAGPSEVAVALDAGAEGVGLLRTELSFLEARAWPSQAEHERALAPTLQALGDRVATVRVLDFGGDKLPSFLRGARGRGIELLLDAPEAMEAQLSAILAVRASTELRLLLPMVSGPEQIVAVRQALAHTTEAQQQELSSPLIGAMIETPEAVGAADAIAAEADFLSIGTNDLTAAVLGRDRFQGGEVPTGEPRVLEAISRVISSGLDAEVPVEVCGEAASSPLLMPILVGLGVEELSVGAARVGEVRAWVRALNRDACSGLARRALRAEDAAGVAGVMQAIAEQLGSVKLRDVAGERLNGAAGVASARS